MKKLTLIGSGLAALVLMVSFAISAQAVTPPNWNANGSYVVNMEYLGSDNHHDMTLVQDASGNLTGNGGSPAGANVYTWVITSGSVSGNSIDFLANYTATADAVTPQTVLHVTGTFASNGTISGTWSDNYQGGARAGVLTTVSGSAIALRNLTVTLAGSGIGNVSSSPTGINCGADCSQAYDNNTSVTLTASASAGSTFSGWSGDCSGTGTCVLTMNGAMAVTATFTLNAPVITHTITASAGANGSITPNGSVVLNDGADKKFKITADSGYHVSDVLVDGSSVGAVSKYKFENVTANHTIAASFALNDASGTPQDKKDCKKDGWGDFTNPSFKNQGQCVSSVNHQNKDSENADEDVKANDENKNGNDQDNDEADVEVHGDSQINNNNVGAHVNIHASLHGDENDD